MKRFATDCIARQLPLAAAWHPRARLAGAAAADGQTTPLPDDVCRMADIGTSYHVVYDQKGNSTTASAVPPIQNMVCILDVPLAVWRAAQHAHGRPPDAQSSDDVSFLQIFAAHAAQCIGGAVRELACQHHHELFAAGPARGRGDLSCGEHEAWCRALATSVLRILEQSRSAAFVAEARRLILMPTDATERRAHQADGGRTERSVLQSVLLEKVKRCFSLS
ncbi:hypothetical protein STCU_11530 [Strigomonas culicis]|uniref:Uncharacterized protein n=1 Tax=Strigomonas culicis TaxID=28005 RepID=S9UN99_9TRYP|nr:hypothetical protein STCU_11530 [Strigomonas culicis]|eukprot:EPY16136.1 hypothetical protein STCU_11530 [Strigomonas culicis]